MKHSIPTFLSRLKTLFLGLTLLIVAMFVIPTALAGNGTITVVPMSSDVLLQSGEKYEGTLVVTNVNSEPYDIEVDVSDILIDQSHNVSFLPASSKNNRIKSLASWVELGDESFQLASGEERELYFVVSVPKEASSGDYFASINIAFLSQNTAPLSGGGVSVRQSLGSLILLKVVDHSEESTVVGVTGSKSFEPRETSVDSDYTSSGLKMVNEDEKISVGLDFSNNTLRYAVFRPLIEIRNEDDEVQYSARGKQQRVFPGESVYVEQSFPASYLQSVEKLALTYSLQDVVSDKLYAQKNVELDTAYEETLLFKALFVGYGRVVLVGGGGLLLMVVLWAWRRKRENGV